MTYGVAALGEVGAGHVIELFREINQLMGQLGCEYPNAMVDHNASQGF